MKRCPLIVLGFIVFMFVVGNLAVNIQGKLGIVHANGNSRLSSDKDNYIPPKDKYPVSTLFAQDNIDFKNGTLKSGSVGYGRILKHLDRSSSSKEDWKMIGSCIAKFRNDNTGDFSPSECNEDKLEEILVAQNYTLTGSDSEPIQRFGEFIPQPNQLVSLGNLRVLSNPKNRSVFFDGFWRIAKG